MKKFFVFFLVLVLVLVSVSCFAFADDQILDSRERERIELEDIVLLTPSRDSPSMVYADQVYKLRNDFFDYDSSFGISLSFYYGDLASSGFVAADPTLSTEIRFQYTSSSVTHCYARINGSYVDMAVVTGANVYMYHPYILIPEDQSVNSRFFDYFDLVEDFSYHSIFESVSSFFVGALGLGSTLIGFIADNWIAIIPLVLWVLIALFGVFRKLFKGV